LFTAGGSEQPDLRSTIHYGWSEASSTGSQALADALFPQNGWLSRPAWKWRRIQNDGRVAEVASPFGARDLDTVFCEDRSQFMDRSTAKTFKADLGTPFDRRWMAGPTGEGFGAGVIYLPAQRLL
jgi:hypothetical protein